MKPVKRLWRALLAVAAAASMYGITAWLAWDSTRGFGSAVDWGWSFIRVESCGNCAILAFDWGAWGRTWSVIACFEIGLTVSIAAAGLELGSGHQLEPGVE